jgi:hypothetical protein
MWISVTPGVVGREPKNREKQQLGTLVVDYGHVRTGRQNSNKSCSWSTLRHARARNSNTECSWAMLAEPGRPRCRGTNDKARRRHHERPGGAKPLGAGRDPSARPGGAQRGKPGLSLTPSAHPLRCSLSRKGRAEAEAKAQRRRMSNGEATWQGDSRPVRATWWTGPAR